MHSELLDYLSVKLIKDIRTMEFKEWNEGLRKEIYRNEELVDLMRDKVNDVDVANIITLLNANNDDEVYMGHCLSRRLLHKPGMRQAVEHAYNKTKLPLAKMGLMHDLLEYKDLSFDLKNDYINYILNSDSEVYEVLNYYFGNEDKIFQKNCNALNDIITEKTDSRYYNCDKAFVYLLYLGKILDTNLRHKVIEYISRLTYTGDNVFNQARRSVLASLN